MSRRLNFFAAALLVLGTLLSTACEPLYPDDPPPLVELGSFPYHPLVFHLDLAILAYQLHGQSVIWPFDPFYEERDQGAGLSRDDFISRVRDFTKRYTADGAPTGLDHYRGPGTLGGFANNPAHDPIIYNYSRIHPWSYTIVNPSGEWIEYQTPSLVTANIRDLYVAYRRANGAPTDTVIDAVPASRNDTAVGGNDVLIAFEGGTGDKGIVDQPASQSLMGFVLVRNTSEKTYDLHIAFRGSRSGNGGRAVLDAISADEASGNPDWITDLGYDLQDPTAGGNIITTSGAVRRGFARSMESILPNIFLAFSKVAQLKSGVAPSNIFVTGHSLGGGLAQLFVSAILLGNQYGPSGRGVAMPPQLANWPWTSLKLITFGAPRAGDVDWADSLTTAALQSDLFDDPISAWDTDAFSVTCPTIIDRLYDAHRPAAFRVLVSTDIVTTEKLGGVSTHVGKTVYVNGTLITDWFGFPNANSHEPVTIRQFMLDTLQDPRIPQFAWRYRPLTDFAPDRDSGQHGSDAEFHKLGAAILGYYRDHNLYFNADAFSADLQLMFTIAGAGG